MKIKICGIQNEIIAEKICQLKPNYLGVVFHPGSKRYVSDLNTAKKITEVCQKNNVHTVGVFVHHTLEEIENICIETGIQFVQLYGEKIKQQHLLLPALLKRIYVISVPTSGEPKILSYELEQLCPNKDYILFDNQNPGFGKLINRCFLSRTLDKYASLFDPFRCFLAGGLNPDNIKSIISQNHLQNFYGLDVSSGVEKKSGEKCLCKIKQFILRGNAL